ncbi:MAG: hypothetical protein IJS86_02565, partial [Lachnospiraceae bacterium]|nr:hypothetical protein [Lachnospiraceae bacterium]
MGKTLTKREKLQKRIFQIVEVGYTADIVSRIYDYAGVAAIIINLMVSVMYTFAPIKEKYGNALLVIEHVTV